MPNVGPSILPKAHRKIASSPVFLTIGGRRSAAQDEFFDETTRQYEAGLRHLRETRYVDFPQMVGIETMAVCNAACDFCPYPTMERKGDRMPDALLRRLIDEIDAEFPKDLPLAINLSRINEPFLDKRLFPLATDIFRRLPQASIWIYTNASPLVTGVAERLTEWPRVEHFNISFNDHRPEEYERVMQIPFARTVENIDRLHALHDAGRLAFTPKISRVGDHTDADDAFKAWVHDRWPRFSVHVWERYDFVNAESVFDPGPVPAVGCQHWFRMPILASGKVILCCADSHGSAPIDDVNERSILEVYNTPERRRLRLDLPSRTEVDPCYACARH